MSGLLFKNTSKAIDHYTIDISFSDKLEKILRKEKWWLSGGCKGRIQRPVNRDGHAFMRFF